MDVSKVKFSLTSKRTNSSLININDHLKAENTGITKDLVRKFNNMLEPLLLERIDSIRLSTSKYLVTSFVDFSIYRQSFASFLVY